MQVYTFMQENQAHCWQLQVWAIIPGGVLQVAFSHRTFIKHVMVWPWSRYKNISFSMLIICRANNIYRRDIIYVSICSLSCPSSLLLLISPLVFSSLPSPACVLSSSLGTNYPHVSHLCLIVPLPLYLTRLLLLSDARRSFLFMSCSSCWLITGLLSWFSYLFYSSAWLDFLLGQTVLTFTLPDPTCVTADPVLCCSLFIYLVIVERN